MASSKEALLLLFTRPTEPIFMPRAKGNTLYVYQVPDRYFIYKYRVIKKKLIDRFSTKGVVAIPIKNVTVPDISSLRKLDMEENFTVFIEDHAELAAQLIGIFMEQRSVDDFLSVAVYCHDRINPYLFNYALSIAVLHREDTRDVVLPNFLECFPSNFIGSSILAKARKEIVIFPRENRSVITIPREFTANYLEPEQKVAYFREDIGINLHHWHWHLVYPTAGSLVNKDRRGELFYYMHQQVIARYNAERFAANLPYVVNYSDFRNMAIAEGYFSKLELSIAGTNWSSRQVNTKVNDITKSGVTNVSISQMETWEKNIVTAITTGIVTPQYIEKIVYIDNEEGIDILGNLVESSELSLNRPYYGNYHNMGHLLTAHCHDPDGRFLEGPAVMANTTTAMRDPIFYRWHNKINDIFVLHKDRLPSYSIDNLNFDNVIVQNVTVTGKSANTFVTHWQRSTVDLSRGLDFARSSPILTQFTHLQHEPFTYQITIYNRAVSVFGTVRIFMAPKYNDRNVLMSFNEQRKLMIEMDKFRINLRSGLYIITRSSGDSSVTIPFERTFRNLNDQAADQKFNFCGCGWPQHMLVPKGTLNGMKFELFVMISDYTLDVPNPPPDTTGICSDADSYCGILDNKFPDKRSMGYPFDRVGRSGVSTLSQFLTPNMTVQEVTVKFEERTVDRSGAERDNVSVVSTKH